MKTLLQFVTLATLATACNKPTTFNLEKAKAAISEANQKFMDAVSTGDSLGYAALYHSEAVLMPPNTGPLSGTDQLIAFFNGAKKAGVGSITLQTGAVTGNEDNVIEEGAYQITDKSGTALDNGKYVVIWKKENDQWKLYRDIWNTSVPMPTPEPAPAK